MTARIPCRFAVGAVCFILLMCIGFLVAYSLGLPFGVGFVLLGDFARMSRAELGD